MGGLKKNIIALWWALFLLMLFFCMEVVSPPAQSIFVFFSLCILYIFRHLRTPNARLLIIITAFIIGGRYIFWRATFGLIYIDPLSFISMITLFCAEVFAFALFIAGAFINAAPLRRANKLVDLDPTKAPSVDILIPTYNEPEEILRITLVAALNIRYPNKKVYLLDDGGTDQKCQEGMEAQERRAQLQKLCKDLGATYLTREKNLHAKAGNLNAALEKTSGELILILDADHVPTEDFLERTVFYFLERPKLFLIQTPHFFINPDPIERNLGTFEHMPSENELFYSTSQLGMDTWNASFFCGAAALLRRKAIEEIGGICGETITEDAETALTLHAKGWESLYVNRPMIAGLSPETLTAFLTQRMRWAQGMSQIFILKNPLLKKGLSWPQKISYLGSCTYWFFGFARLVFMTAPLFYLIGGIYVYKTPLSQFFLYTVPHLISLTIAAEVMYGRQRWPFMAELFEAVQAFYCARAVLQVFRNPRAPSFVVTPKSEMIDKAFISPVAPFFYGLFVLQMTGFFCGIWRFISTPQDQQIVFYTMLWNILNILLSIAAVGVTYERPQTRRAHRLKRQDSVRINDKETAEVIDISVYGVKIQGNHGTPGTYLSLRFEEGITLKATIINSTETTQCAFSFKDPKDFGTAVELFYGKSTAWREFQHERSQKYTLWNSVVFLIERGFSAFYDHAKHLSSKLKDRIRA